MQRVIALILSLIVCLAPVFPAPGSTLPKAETGCCGGQDGAPCCPLCAELHRQARHCPCAPAPERPTSGFDRDQAAAAPVAARRVVVRRSQVPDTTQPTTWAATTSTATPFRLAPTAAVTRAQPLRAALCIWTT